MLFKYIRDGSGISTIKTICDKQGVIVLLLRSQKVRVDIVAYGKHAVAV